MDIHTLAKEGNFEKLSELLNCGDVSKAREIATLKDSLSRTPLHLASYFGHPALVELLIEYSDVDCVASDGFTPLHFAAQRGHIEVVRKLLIKANVNRKTFKSLNALHLACLKSSPGSKHEEVIKDLIRKGADATAKTKQGKTAIDLIVDGDLKERVTKMLSDEDLVRKGTRSRNSHAS